jgi:hypothetical protein
MLPFSGRLFSHLLVGERLRQLCTLTSLHDSSCLGGIKKLCKEANDMVGIKQGSVKFLLVCILFVLLFTPTHQQEEGFWYGA